MDFFNGHNGMLMPFQVLVYATRQEPEASGPKAPMILPML
jgi:hypothetical protein